MRTDCLLTIATLASAFVAAGCALDHSAARQQPALSLLTPRQPSCRVSGSDANLGASQAPIRTVAFEDGLADSTPVQSPAAEPAELLLQVSAGPDANHDDNRSGVPDADADADAAPVADAAAEPSDERDEHDSPDATDQPTGPSEEFDPSVITEAGQPLLTDPSAAGIEIESLVQQAIAANPSIKQAEAAVAAAIGIHHQVGLRPNPTVGYFGQEIGNDGRAGQHGIYASNTIVRGNKLCWNRSVAAKDVDRLRWAVEAQRQRVETDVRIRFYQAFTAQQELRRARLFRKDAQRAVEVAQLRLNAEEGSKPDLLQSQIFLDQIDLTIRTVELKFDAAWAQLAAVCATPNMQPAPLIGEFRQVEPLDCEILYQQIAANSPALLAATERVEAERRRLRRQQQQPISNLTTQFGVGYDDSSNDPFASVQLGMPIPIRNNNQGNVSAAQAQYAAAVQNVERLQLALRRDIAAAVRRYETSAAIVEKFETEILPKSAQSLVLVEKAYIAGELNFLRVLTARQSYFELTQQQVAARGELSQVAAELDGMLLANSLASEVTYEGNSGLRGQSLSGQ